MSKLQQVRGDVLFEGERELLDELRDNYDYDICGVLFCATCIFALGPKDITKDMTWYKGAQYVTKLFHF